MSRLIFDIETVGENFDELDEATQHSLTRWIKREAMDESEYNSQLEDVKNGLGFSPLTGQIVALGVYDLDRQQGVVYFQAPDKRIKEFAEDAITYKPMDEAEMLRSFWEGCLKYTEFVTFNGRAFDVPFLMIRSAVHGIKPTQDLMANRYLNKQFKIRHVDLLDQLSFYGAVRRKGSLHLWCRTFGIDSPKESVCGDDVAPLFKKGKYEDIARYNAKDLVATAALYERWKAYLAE